MDRRRDLGDRGRPEAVWLQMKVARVIRLFLVLVVSQIDDLVADRFEVSTMGANVRAQC